MKKQIKKIILSFPILFILAILPSCEKFFNPDQGINITEDKLYSDWYEYRSAILGLYALQTELVEQIVVLGELRGDLLTVTKNADPDLMEIYNFNISKDNKYASPQNFFKLIAATNRFISILEEKQPDVLNPSKQVNNYDRLYGEALCMRAWAYFNAVRIYGKVPFIDQRLSTIEEIEAFINSPATYVDSVYIKYSIDGYHNDTIRNQKVVLEKNYFDTERVILHFTNELETKIKEENGTKAVGVNHYINNNDNSWEVSIWSQWSYNTLLGQMYLTLGDLTKSIGYFEKVVNNNTTNYRYQLDNSFAYGQWRNIFTNIDSREHIFTLWFNKANQQQNGLQTLFEPGGSSYNMLKPTTNCVHEWETVWSGAYIRYDYNLLDSTKTILPGMPNDYSRGFGSSYAYYRNNGSPFSSTDLMKMLEFKRLGEYRSVDNTMENVDTIVFKYSIGKDQFDRDANFIIYRAAGVNLYMAEIYNYWNYLNPNGSVGSFTMNALKIINDGSYYDASVSRVQRGVRGRVGLDPLTIQNINFIFDPFTNKVIGWQDFTGNLLAKQYKLEDEIMDERARELAFEGERYYDLMRVAMRRNDPSFLAEKVSEKYPAGQREYIYNLLLNEKNWYINIFQ